jgi:hypothetical protein
MEAEMSEKCFFAAHSHMGIEYPYDSPCWVVYAFGTKQERDSWVAVHEYNENGNRVAKVVTKREAIKIAPELKLYFSEEFNNINFCRRVVVPPPNPSPAAILGRMGGLKTSPIKAEKSRENGKKGGKH